MELSTNLGAIFRAVAGLGVDAVLLSPTCAVAVACWELGRTDPL
ncbi:hypothetical protein QTQ03_09465 [Micromonospora sp. WMMA1363]|nr:hypothetical protein [Micromonospora sp. WMMA1363]MDM4719792.1 hypothetical protein [Micromonospora sp. WMMA1363]